MRIGVQTAGMEEIYGTDGAYRLIAECGFDAADANIDLLLPGKMIVQKKIPSIFLGNDKDCLPAFLPWRDAAIKYKLGNDQAHAPFPSCIWSPEEPEYNNTILEMLRKFIIGCDYIGCRKLVIHPFGSSYERYITYAQEFEDNIKGYSNLADTAKKYGVTICLENCYNEHNGKVMFGIGSDIPETCSLIDELNQLVGEKVFGFCLDIGHMLLMGMDVRRVMENIGSRLCAIHIHDNNGIADQHLAPYMGIMDWNSFILALKANQYKGTLSFETFNIWNCIDRKLCPEFMKFLAKTGRYFSERLSCD